MVTDRLDGPGPLVRARRIASGIRQKDLAHEAGISASYLALIESGRRVPDARLRSRIAAALGLDENGLSDGVRGRQATALRGIRGAAPVDARESADALAMQFPGWADLLLRIARDFSQTERRVSELSDPLRHDERLSARLHEVLSAAASISSTASILEDDAINANWRRRFVRNIGEDATRLQSAASVLSGWIEEDTPRGADREDPERWFSSRGGMAAVLKGDWRAALDGDPSLPPATGDLLRGLLSRLEADAALLPDIPLDADPVRLAADRGLDACVALRRAAVIRDAGLVVSGAAGPPILIGLPPGFPVPARGDACPLWPLHHAGAGRPDRAVCQAADKQEGRFRCTAAAAEIITGGVPLVERVMLIEEKGEEAERPIGPGCASCPATHCPARRGGMVAAAG